MYKPLNPQRSSRCALFAATIALAALGLAALSGCGGSTGGLATGGNGAPSSTRSATGTIRLTVSWPSKRSTTRVIPAATASITVEARNGDSVKTGTITAPETTLTLTGVPAGNTVIRAYAYDGPGGSGTLLASGETTDTIKSDSERNSSTPQNESVVLGEVPPPVPVDKYVLGGTAAIDPDEPSLIRMTLNAIVNRADGTTIDGLTADNFTVLEDGISRAPLIVSQVNGSKSKADIAFIVDTTGSMSDEIAGVRNSIVAFVQSLEDAGVDVQVGGVDFGDEVRTSYPLTTDEEAFKGWVSGLDAYGGDDLPENPLDAINTSLSFNWRPDAQHTIVVITDAVAHTAGDGSGVTAETFDDIIDKTIGNFVIDTISPGGGSRAASLGQARSADNGPTAYSKRAAIRPAAATRSAKAATRDVDGTEDVASLSSATGGIWSYLPYSGTVDLTTLPIKDAILKGYLIKFTAPRTYTAHHLRVVVKYEGEYVADQTFAATY